MWWHRNFVGAAIEAHADGRHCASAAYDALCAKAGTWGVPIYMHPTWDKPHG